jgi:hypothetical protein
MRLTPSALFLGAAGFVGVFILLAARFGYPDVLDAPAPQVLAQLAAAPDSLRVVWAVYAVLPLALALAALGLHPHLRLSPTSARVVTAAGLLAGGAMSFGLLRWSTLNWSLARAWSAAGAETRRALEAVFDAGNLWLGNALGELVGELALAVWLVGAARAPLARWAAWSTAALGLVLGLGAFRQVWPTLAVVTELTNLWLPVGLVALAVALVRSAPMVRFAPPAPVWTAALVLGLVLAASPAAAGPDRELIVHGFRAPSTGVELRQGVLGFHVGLYPTTIDHAANGESRTTWFLKTGLTAYFLGFDTGSGRDSSPYVGVSLVQGLGNDWDVSRSTTTGAGGTFEAGFRWAVYEGLDLRLGASVLAGFDGRVRVNPTPGIGWSVPY